MTFFRAKYGKLDASQYLRSSHASSWRAQLRNQGVVAGNSEGLPATGHFVEYVARVAGQFCSADGVHIVQNMY